MAAVGSNAEWTARKLRHLHLPPGVGLVDGEVRPLLYVTQATLEHVDHVGKVIHTRYESRAHRKGVATTDVRRPAGKYWCWKFQKISYWVALLFFIGSLFFCFASLAAYCEKVDTNRKFKAYIGWPSFVGSVFFTIGSYLQLLEVLNVAPTPLAFKDHPDVPKRKWRWIGFEPHRLDFVIAWVQQVGALIFNVNTLTGSGAFEWANLGLHLAVWFPDVLASCCFVASGYLGLIEYTHCMWMFTPLDPIWWLNIANTAGGIGFLLNAVFGIAWLEPSLAYERGLVLFPLLFGSVCFQCGSYLAVWEQANGESDAPQAGTSVPEAEDKEKLAPHMKGAASGSKSDAVSPSKAPKT